MSYETHNAPILVNVCGWCDAEFETASECFQHNISCSVRTGNQAAACANCKREIGPGEPYYYIGRRRFCSLMCRDTSAALRRRAKCRLCDKPIESATAVPGANHYCSKDCEVRFLGIDVAALGGSKRCEVEGCHVCSGAMRERAGRGDRG